jgi:hypothetical protein
MKEWLAGLLVFGWAAYEVVAEIVGIITFKK